MRNILVIGVGAGNLEHVTVQAINAMNRVDVFFVADKGSTTDDLVRLRQEVCARYISQPDYRVVDVPDPPRDRGSNAYRAAVETWHRRRVEVYEQAIDRELEDHQTGAFLVWGDPSLYDSTLRVIDQILDRGNVEFAYEVIPGISSVQALAARHRTPLHAIGEPVLITTGRRLLQDWQRGVPNVVVMLDGECAFRNLDDDNVDIAWAANLGLDDEVALAGPLNQVGEEIQRLRAQTRSRRGWIMDTYLLRRRAD